MRRERPILKVRRRAMQKETEQTVEKCLVGYDYHRALAAHTRNSRAHTHIHTHKHT